MFSLLINFLNQNVNALTGYEFISILILQQNQSMQYIYLYKGSQFQNILLEYIFKMNLQVFMLPIDIT